MPISGSGFSLLILFACNSSNSESESVHKTGGNSVGDSVHDYKLEKVIKFRELQEYITSSANDRVKVINFWATCCGPCVKELPFIDSLRYAYDPDKVEVLLVSLDFPDELTKGNKFIQRKKIGSTVWLLDESDPNLFIDQVMCLIKAVRWYILAQLIIMPGMPASADKFYVEEAIKALESNKAPKVSKTKAIGCTIKCASYHAPHFYIS